MRPVKIVEKPTFIGFAVDLKFPAVFSDVVVHG